jgi:radical SAM superfamily enzyme YgiQ (UPF0313 family)
VGKKKKILMIFPDFEGTPLKYRAYIHPLGLLSLAAVTPEEYDVSFVDERAEEVPRSTDADIVAISAMTPQAQRAYDIADRYRRDKIPVVLGGAHPSLLPEEAIQHADAVLVGEAEGLWEELLSDLEKGTSREFYVCLRKPDLSGIPLARYELLNEEHYLPIRSVQVSRGCPLNCEFCTVPKTFGREYRIKPVKETLSDLQTMTQHLYFVDDNILLKRRNFTALFEQMAALDKKWIGMAPLQIAGDKKYVELIASSGCWSLYVDMGPWISMGLKEGVSSLKNQVEKSVGYIKTLQDSGIKVMGSFVFGFDHDDESVFERTFAFLEKTGIVEAEFLILTPYPNTPLAAKLSSQGRIISTDWSKYNTAHAVFLPKKMSPEKLEEGVSTLWREFYEKLDRVEQSLDSDAIANALHRRILAAVPSLFRDITHRMVKDEFTRKRTDGGDQDETALVLKIWREKLPPVFSRMLSDVLGELEAERAPVSH